ncbi:MAG: hypothetical protein HYU28_07720 [Actinobacteria bacterium]|nr:hypothetical protein [Actinomycetota bacterium]
MTTSQGVAPARSHRGRASLGTIESNRRDEVSTDAPLRNGVRRSARPDPAEEAADVFLTVADLQRRYRIGRTRVYRLIKEPWFPKPVVGGTYRWSLASVRAAEDARADRQWPPVAPPQLKRRRRPNGSA